MAPATAALVGRTCDKRARRARAQPLADSAAPFGTESKTWMPGSTHTASPCETAGKRRPGMIRRHGRTQASRYHANTRQMARALAYARRGWSIFPCKRGDKRPLDRLVPHGLNDSTTDEATIAEWWTTAEPEANIGIDTGRSGLFVVDIDRQHDGPAAWAALTANRGAPRTATVLTPNRGTHLYFKRPVGVHVGIDHGKRLGPGIDIRGIGGYVVAAGSERPEGAYRWGESSIVANAPQWLLDLVTADPKPFPTSDVPAGGCIPEG